MSSIPSNCPTVWAMPVLPHDMKQKRRLAAVGFLYVLSLLWIRLYANDLNLSNNNSSSSSTVFFKEVVNLTESKQQQSEQQPEPEQQHQKQPLDVPHNNSAPLTASIVLQMPLPSSVKIHQLWSNLKSCSNTIVTGYFQLRSKHRGNEYLEWMKNLLSIQDCMIIMTESSMVETITSLRQHVLDGTAIIEMINGVNDLPISQLHAEEQEAAFWSHQFAIDREKRIHQSYQVFWIWLSKTWCVAQAIQKDYFHSNFYMWQDIGSYRTEEYNGKMIIQHPEIVPDGTLLWMAHNQPNPPKSGPIWDNKLMEPIHFFHSGSQAAGNKDTWIEYHVRFAEVIDEYIEKNMFIGEDQCVLQGTCQKYPDLCAYIQAKDVNDNNYFGLRYALHHGGSTAVPWQMPGVKNNQQAVAASGVEQSDRSIRGRRK